MLCICFATEATCTLHKIEGIMSPIECMCMELGEDKKVVEGYLKLDFNLWFDCDAKHC